MSQFDFASCNRKPLPRCQINNLMDSQPMDDKDNYISTYCDKLLLSPKKKIKSRNANKSLSTYQERF